MNKINNRFKFRLWNKNAKSFVKDYSDSGQEINAEITLLNTLINSCSNLDNYIIKQSTNIQDINNKTIYEGDIVKILDDNIAVCLANNPKYNKGVVTWLREGFSLCQSGEGFGANEIYHYIICDCCPARIEIIGNIFENPELLDK